MGCTIFGFFAGLITGAALALALCVAAAWLFDITQAEGSLCNGRSLFWMPAGALVGGVLGAILCLRLNAPRWR